MGICALYTNRRRETDYCFNTNQAACENRGYRSYLHIAVLAKVTQRWTWIRLDSVVEKVWKDTGRNYGEILYITKFGGFKK